MSINDGMVWVRVGDDVEFPVHHTQWNDPESRRVILVGEIDDYRRSRRLAG
jgi:hypothetical protein